MPGYDDIIDQMKQQPDASTPPPAGNGYDDIVGQMKQQETARAATLIGASTDTNADRAATNRALAKRYNTLPEVVDKFPDEFRQRMSTEIARDALNQAPVLRGMVNRNPGVAPVLQDSLENAAAIEKASGPSFRALPDRQPSIRDRLANWWAGVTGGPTAEEQRKQQGAAEATAILAARKADPSLVPPDNATLAQIEELNNRAWDQSRQAIGGMSQVPQIAAERFANAATFGVVSPSAPVQPHSWQSSVAGGLGSLAGFVAGPAKVAAAGLAKVPGFAGLTPGAGEAFTTALSKTVVQQAATLAAATALQETGSAVLDSHSAKEALDRVIAAGKSGAETGAVFGAAGRVLPDSTLPQWVLRTLGVSVAQDAINNETPWDNRPLEDKVFGYGMNALFSAHGTGRTGGNWFTDNPIVREGFANAEKADAAQRDFAQLKALSDLASASPVRKRDPDLFRQHIEEVTAGGHLEAVYVDAREFVNALNQSGIPPEEIAARMPDVAAQIHEATQTHGDIRIPTADYETHVAGSRLDEALLPHLKTDPDGKTYAESQAFYQGEAEHMKDSAAKIVDAKQAEDAHQADRQAVYDHVLGQLADTKRFPDAVNKAYASMWREFYATNAARMGITPTEMLARYPVKVQAEKLAAGATLDQEGKRAAYDPATKTIALFKDADLTSFLHESGHFYLDALHDMTSHPEAPAGIKEDFDTLLRSYGEQGTTAADRLASWSAKTLDEKRAAHEQFAQGFEKYLMEGKAPSVELSSLFARFRSWLLQVYKSVAGLRAEVSPEVRGVMDRLLASEEAIKQAEQVRGFAPLFTSAEAAGLTPEEFAAYQQLGADATAGAIDEMQAKSLRDMKWLSGARSKALREAQREAAGIRREVRDQVAKEVDQIPVYAAERWIKTGEMVNEKGELIKADGEAKKGAKINTEALREMYPASMLNRPDMDRLRGLTGPQGMHPEMVASMFGFDSADQFIRALADREPKESVIEGLTDRRMLEQHGELATSDAIERAADEAVHNQARAKFMARGLEILSKARGSGRLLEMGAREAAKAAIAGRRIGDVNPRRYLAAEARANREAIRLAPKDPAGAATAQRAALLNNALVREAQDAVDDVRKAVAYARSFEKRAKRLKIDPQERDMIDALLVRFDFRQVPTNSESKKQVQLRQWVDSQKALGYTPAEIPDMLDEAVRMHYKDMTVEQLRGLMDTVRSIEQIGRERKMVTVDGTRMDVAEAVAPMVNAMQARGEKFTDAQLADPPRRGVDPLWRVTLDRLGSWLRAGVSELTRPDYKANKYDQHQLLGPFQKAFSERLIGAAYRFGDYMDGIGKLKKQRMAEYGLDKEWQKSLTDVVDKHNLLDNSLDVPRRRRLTRGDMIGIAMHVGNESNFDKLVKGMGWQPEEIWQALHDNMREKDWRAAQLLGEMAGANWDEMAAMNRRLGNDTPEKIEPRPFVTKYGEMPGWYAPVRYDPIRSKLGRKKAEGNSINPQEGLFGRNYFRADTTTNGSLNSRVAGYHDFIDLDWHPIEKSISDTLRDLAYRESLIDVHKIYAHPEFRQQFQRTYGPEEYKHLGDWMGRLVNSEVGDEMQSKLTAIAAQSRRAIVANGVAFRISTMLKHGLSAGFKSTGYFAGGGEKHFKRRIAQLSTNYSNEVAEALAKFPEIRQRLRQQDRDYSAAAKAIFEPESMHGKAERFGHAGVAWLDFLTAVPTAHAAYDWAITEGIPKRLGGTGVPMSEADAIKFASKTVREAHGSTNEASMSLLINNRSEIVKMLTVLHGFMNNSFGQSVDALDKVLHAEGFGKPELFARVFMAQIVPAIMAGWVTFGGPKENETWLGWFFHNVFSEAAAMLPMVREAWSAVAEGNASAGSPPWIRALGDIYKAGRSVVKGAGGEPVKHPIKDVGNAAGLLLPGLGQAGATSQFLYDVGKGDQHPETVGEWTRGVMSGDAKH